MIYSNACEYGIRAMVHLADYAVGTRVLAREVSEKESIPGPFLGKVFQTLVKAGLLTSSKGPGGGFSLARESTDISLYDIRAAIDGVRDLESCAVGLEECSDQQRCPLHDSWSPIRDRIKSYLVDTTLADMAAATRRKKSMLRK